MNAQQVFDKVATHLLTQKKRAVVNADFERCMYRAPAGRKCAAGCLITDRNYRKEMEGKTIDLVARLFKLPQFFQKHRSLIQDLQMVHDVYQPNEWRSSLRRVAESHNLNTDALKRV